MESTRINLDPKLLKPGMGGNEVEPIIEVDEKENSEEFYFHETLTTHHTDTEMKCLVCN